MYLDNHLSTNLENQFTTLVGKLHFLYLQFTPSFHWCYEQEPSRNHTNYNKTTLNVRTFAPCGKVIVSQFINSQDITWNITTQKMFGIIIYFKCLKWTIQLISMKIVLFCWLLPGITFGNEDQVWRKCGHHQPWTSSSRLLYVFTVVVWVMRLRISWMWRCQLFMYDSDISTDK